MAMESGTFLPNREEGREMNADVRIEEFRNGVSGGIASHRNMGE
jgi:hypothetical protein